MERSARSRVCKECGFTCSMCVNNNLDLHREIEELKVKIVQSNRHVQRLESEFAESQRVKEQELGKYQEELARLRDRYDRLLESHRKLQKVNNNLEDKLITVVSKLEQEKTSLQSSYDLINEQLMEKKARLKQLEDDCKRYQNDCSLAVQLLQCRPHDFVAHRLNTLPLTLQERIRVNMSDDERISLAESSDQPTDKFRLPFPTFPPTAAFSVNKSASMSHILDPPDAVPASVLAKTLSMKEIAASPDHICSKCQQEVNSLTSESQTQLIQVNGKVLDDDLTNCSATPGVHLPRT